MTVESDIAQPREYEMRTYLLPMKAMYENAITRNGSTYDIACKLARAFSNITESSVLEDSRIIEVFKLISRFWFQPAGDRALTGTCAFLFYQSLNRIGHRLED